MSTMQAEHPLYHLARHLGKFEEKLENSHDVHLRNTRALLGYRDFTGINVSYPKIGPCYEIATNLLVSYHLFDCIAAYPSIAGLSVQPAVSNELRSPTWTTPMLETIKGWDAVREWPATLQKARGIISSSTHLNIGKPVTTQASVMHNLLRSLSSGHQTKHYYTICGNFEAAALYLSILRDADWLSSSSASDIPNMDEKLAIMAMDLGNSGDDWQVANFLKSFGKNMRVPLQLALIVSPIYLLSTSTLYKRAPTQKDLWRLCTSIGNDKPDMLKKVESAIWRTLWNISRNCDTARELKNLVCMPEWEEWENTTNPNDGVLFFRSPGQPLSPRGGFITDVPGSNALETPESDNSMGLGSQAPQLVGSAPQQLLLIPGPIGNDLTQIQAENTEEDEIGNDGKGADVGGITGPRQEFNLIDGVEDSAARQEPTSTGQQAGEDSITETRNNADFILTSTEQTMADIHGDVDMDVDKDTQQNEATSGPQMQSETPGTDMNSTARLVPVATEQQAALGDMMQDIQKNTEREVEQDRQKSDAAETANILKDANTDSMEISESVATAQQGTTEEQQAALGDMVQDIQKNTEREVEQDRQKSDAAETANILKDANTDSMEISEPVATAQQGTTDELIPDAQKVADMDVDEERGEDKEENANMDISGDVTTNAEGSNIQKENNQKDETSKGHEGKTKRVLLARTAKTRKSQPYRLSSSHKPSKGKRKNASKENENDNDEEDEDEDIVFIGMERRVTFTPREITLDLERSEVQIVHSDAKIQAYSPFGKMYDLDLIAHDEKLLNTLEEIGRLVQGKSKFLTDPRNSMIRVMNKDEYEALGAEDLLFIFRQQHIVVINPNMKSHFNVSEPDSFRQALRGLGSLTSPRTIQDLSIMPNDGNLNDRHRIGTLKQIYDASFEGIPKIINALDIPLEMKGMRDLKVSTDYAALYATMGDWKTSRPFAAGRTRWGLAATEGAFHGWHIDSNGLGTFIEPQCGAKLWILGRPKDHVTPRLDDISFFLSDSYELDGCNSSLIDFEAIVLVPGTELIMKPNTIHMVYTPIDSVCHGGHFYSAGNMMDTLAAICHAFVVGDLVTNTNHTPTRLHLQQMILFYHHAYVQGTFEGDDPAMEHVPETDDWEGVMNVFCLCVYAVLMNVLDFNTYFISHREATEGIPMTTGKRSQWLKDDTYAMTYQERKACMHARGEAMEIMQWFGCHFDVQLGNRKGTIPVYKFYQRLVGHYSKLLLEYKKMATKVKGNGPSGCTFDDVRTQLMGVGSGEMNEYVQGTLEADTPGTCYLTPTLREGQGLVFTTSPTRMQMREDLWCLGKSSRDDIYLASIQRIKQEQDIQPAKKRPRI